MIREQSNEGPSRPEVAAVGLGGFRFECTLCGDCCTGSQVVRLTGGDLELLVRRLSLGSVSDLRTQGLVSLVREPVGADVFVWRPQIRFRTKPVRQCPFLINDVGLDSYRGLCSLHPHDKPLVCSLSPLAREVDDPGTGPATETWSFVPPVEGCPGVGRGPVLAVGSPADLQDRLAAEVLWMRRWITASAGCESESEAWVRLEALEASP